MSSICIGDLRPGFSEVGHLKAKLSRLLHLPLLKYVFFRRSLVRMVIPKRSVTSRWVSCLCWVWQVSLEPSRKDCWEANSQDENVFGVVDALMPGASKD